MTTKSLRRQAIALLITSAVLVPVVTLAQGGNQWGLNNLANSTNLGNQDLVETIGKLINVILGFLGIIAFIIILFGGFKWMLSQGDEGKIGEARKLMGAGVVGLAIVLASWAVAQFIINQLTKATGTV